MLSSKIRLQNIRKKKCPKIFHRGKKTDHTEEQESILTKTYKPQEENGALCKEHNQKTISIQNLQISDIDKKKKQAIQRRGNSRGQKYIKSYTFPLVIGEMQIKTTVRASLVAQWLRTCLPMQGTWVQALVQEDPTCFRATKPVRHNC